MENSVRFCLSVFCDWRILSVFDWGILSSFCCQQKKDKILQSTKKRTKSSNQKLTKSCSQKKTCRLVQSGNKGLHHTITCGNELKLRISGNYNKKTPLNKKPLLVQADSEIWTIFIISHTQPMQMASRNSLCGACAHGKHNLQKRKIMKIVTCSLSRAADQCGFSEEIQEKQKHCCRPLIWGRNGMKNSEFPTSQGTRRNYQVHLIRMLEQDRNHFHVQIV